MAGLTWKTNLHMTAPANEITRAPRLLETLDFLAFFRRKGRDKIEGSNP
jgi:hypothetical protein